MLLICSSRNQLDFRQLMTVYSESNFITGMERYPNLDSSLQCMEAEQDFYLYLQVFFCADDAKYFIWAPDGCYKAALRLEKYRDGFLITGLETAPESRRMGFAKKLLSETLHYMDLTGTYRIYSHIRKNNIASIRTHTACGFEWIYDYASYLDGSVDFHSYTYLKSAVPK